MTSPRSSADSRSVLAHVGVGSNLGDRERFIRQGIDFVAAHPAVTVGRVSRLLETEAVGVPGPLFLNGAFEARTTLEALEFLRVLQEAEARAGRTRGVRWGPRTLDLDLLLFGRYVIRGPDLTVPHPRLHEREFVLRPLAEIAPQVMVPGLEERVAMLLERSRIR